MSATSMRTALQDAGLGTYYPTAHAIERIKARFGVAVEDISCWVKRNIAKAKPIVENNGGNTMILETSGIRFVVDRRNNAIVTVYHPIRLDFLRPALEREIRKIKREYTRKIRHTERSLAGQYKRLAEQMTNYANARNPNTRALIGERIGKTENLIDGIKRSIGRLKSEQKTRVRAIEVISE